MLCLRSFVFYFFDVVYWMYMCSRLVVNRVDFVLFFFVLIFMIMLWVLFGLCGISSCCSCFCVVCRFFFSMGIFVVNVLFLWVSLCVVFRLLVVVIYVLCVVMIWDSLV